MKCITDPSPKVALKRNFFFWKLCCFACIVYKTLLDADRHLSPYSFESRAFGRVLIFLLHHLVDFKPAELSVPFSPCLCGSIIMTSTATLVIVQWVFLLMAAIYMPGALAALERFPDAMKGGKIKQFLRVWNAFPGN